MADLPISFDASFPTGKPPPVEHFVMVQGPPMSDDLKAVLHALTGGKPKGVALLPNGTVRVSYTIGTETHHGLIQLVG